MSRQGWRQALNSVQVRGFTVLWIKETHQSSYIETEKAVNQVELDHQWSRSCVSQIHLPEQYRVFGYRPEESQVLILPHLARPAGLSLQVFARGFQRQCRGH